MGAVVVCLHLPSHVVGVKVKCAEVLVDLFGWAERLDCGGGGVDEGGPEFGLFSGNIRAG